MRRLVVLMGALLSAVAFPGTLQADEKSDAVLNELATQLKEMRSELNALRQENQRLQAMVAQQPQADANPNVHAPGGSETPANLFGDDPVRIYTRPGGRPPSWLDMLIERNRMRTMEAWDRARLNERLVDERLSKISAESRALGAGYMPRILRDAVLGGGDAKQHRDRLVAARSSDFDALFGRTEVKDYLEGKAARLSTRLSSTNESPGGQIAPANVSRLTDRLRRDLQDTTILYGRGGYWGLPPAEYNFAEDMMRLHRDSPDPLVSGPTRDALGMARRGAAVDYAVIADVDIDLLKRMKQVHEANRRMNGGYGLSPVHIAEDLAQVNSVLNGKVSRTTVPEVHMSQEFKPQGP